MKHYAIAIDGPSGAGKSTLARAVAGELSACYVDTGAIYRTLGLHVLRAGADPKDGDQVSALLASADIDLGYDEEGLQHMYLSGEDVSEEIRRPEISLYASAVSAIPAVRDRLLEMQRALPARFSVIMDGRDIGTVVLPNADVKVYLTASAEERARRREKELKERGTPQSYEEVLRDMIARDEQDMNRAVAPLRQAEDAVLLDTTHLNFDESREALLRIIRERLPL